MSRSKRRFYQYASVPVEMMGTLPDLTRFSSDRRTLTETNLTPDMQVVAARNCHTINRLKAALAMRRYSLEGLKHAHR